MKHTILISILILIFLSACKDQNKPQTTSTIETKDTVISPGPRQEALHHFITKIRLLPDSDLSLDFTLIGQDLNGKRFDPYSSDSLFIGSDPGYICGMMHDTSRYYGILYYAAVEAGALSLMVIDKNGMVKGDTMLTTGLYAGNDMGYQGTSRIYIHRDARIIICDTLYSYETHMDSIIPPDDMSLWKHEAVSQQINITSDGRIIFSPSKKNEFK